MKTLFLPTVLFLLFQFVAAQNTPLQIVTFNPVNAAMTVVAPVNDIDTVYKDADGMHPCDHGALAPERGWFIFIGRTDSTPYTLYTVNLANGQVVYSTPAWFAGNFKEYFYSDTIGKLVGIYTDTAANGQRYFASCDLQTGAINQLANTRALNPIATYSHTREVFYFLNRYDSTLYKADPVSGQIDSVALQLTDYTNIFSPLTSRPIDLQYDDANQRLLALSYRQQNGPDYVILISANVSTGAISYLRTLDITAPFFVTDAFYHFVYDETADRYLYGGSAGMGTFLSSKSSNSTNDTLFMLYPGPGNIFSDSVIVMNFAYDYVTQKIYGLKPPYTAPVIIPIPPAQTLCKVTVDSNSTHNVIVWEKLNKEATDSFRIYRETATNQYTEIATIPRDSLSEYHDYSANPNITGYRYKISVKDTNGIEGPRSAYHNTIHLQYLGGGNLIWNLYAISNGSLPISTYDVMIDATGTGNWTVLVNVPGTQSTTTDINFNTHPNAQYRLVANWSYNCVPTRSSYPAVFSNIINLQNQGLDKTGWGDVIRLYPNPASNSVAISIDEPLIGSIAMVTDITGRKITGITLNSQYSLLNTENMQSGVYLVTVIGKNQSATKKLIVNH